MNTDFSILRRVWCRDTSADPERWSESNPAWGQCAVSALYVQSCCGGSLIRVWFEMPQGQTGSHYLNVLPNGKLLDTTFEQFGASARFEPGLYLPASDLLVQTEDYVQARGYECTRDYVLSSQDTQKRYATLIKRLQSVSEG